MHYIAVNETEKKHRLLISNRKRAAEQRIKSYFQQLTKGCGVTECDNEYCASSGKMKLMANNDAAVLALQLFKSKAKLCDPLQLKPKGLITVENHKGTYCFVK